VKADVEPVPSIPAGGRPAQVPFSPQVLFSPQAL